MSERSPLILIIGGQPWKQMRLRNIRNSDGIRASRIFNLWCAISTDLEKGVCRFGRAPDCLVGHAWVPIMHGLKPPVYRR